MYKWQSSQKENETAVTRRNIDLKAANVYSGTQHARVLFMVSVGKGLIRPLLLLPENLNIS